MFLPRWLGLESGRLRRCSRHRNHRVAARRAAYIAERLEDRLLLTSLFAQDGDWIIGVTPQDDRFEKGETIGLHTWGVGTLGKGNSEFRINGNGQGPTMRSDHMFQQWFWFGIGDQPEQPLDSLTSVYYGQGQSPDTIVLSYGDASAGDPIAVQVTYQVLGSSLTTSSISETVTITNLTDSQLDLRWFEYTNLDLEGTANDDSAESNAPETVHQTDPIGSFADTLAFPSLPPTHR
jgi:hypothetical protein